jgi:iron complex outermembrane receptor protein
VQKIQKIIARNYFSKLMIMFCCLMPTSLLASNHAIVIPEVNLKPTKITLKEQDTRIQTTHISREEIADSPVVNLTELFQQKQSIVRITNNSGDTSQTALSLRGFGDNAAANSLILVDGFPLTNPSILAPNFNAIPLADIERIDILQGSEGTLWGDQAVGGVINIITRHPKKIFVDATMSVGSFDKIYTNLLGGNKFKNGIFVKAYGTAGKASNYRDHNEQRDGNLSVVAGIDYAHGMLSLTVQSYSNTTDFPGGLSEEQFNGNPTQATNFNNDSHYKTQIIQLMNKQEITDRWVLETHLAHHDTKGDGFVFANFYRDDVRNSFNPRLIGAINDSKITLGYDGQASHYRLSQRQVHSYANATQQNLYLQTVIPLSTKLDFTIGGRGAVQDNSVEKILGNPVNSADRVFVSEQGFTLHLKKNLSFFLRRDGNFSFPKANEQTLLPVNIKALAVQKGTSYEIGSEWLTENQRAQVNLYRLDLQNEIAFNPAQTPAQPFGAFNNLDRTLRYGMTLTEFYRLTPKLSLDGQLNYVYARFAAGVNSGKLIPAVPALTGNLGLNYNMTSRWQAKYALLYTGSRTPSEDVTNSGKQVASYWLNDVAIQYNFKPVMISFEVANLLNQTFSTYIYYNPLTKANTYYPGMGRSYLLSLKVNID